MFIRGRNYEATVVAVDGTLAPSSYFSKNVSTAKDNFTNYDNKAFDEIYTKAVASVDDDEKSSFISSFRIYWQRTRHPFISRIPPTLWQ